MIMRHAVLNNASVIALAHNHPSGRYVPSRQDDDVTESVNKACKVMRIMLADHIIVTERGYYSYRENGRI